MKADLKNFINPSAFEMIMTNQLGWFLKDFKVINGLAIVKPDFYDNDTVIANSKKAVIVCMGSSKFKIGDKEYFSVQNAINEYGETILESFDDWVWLQEKEWVIIKSNNGEWVKTCCVLSDFPFRKQIRC